MKYMMKRAGLIDDNEHRLPMAKAPPELERRLDAAGTAHRAGQPPSIMSPGSR